MFKQLKEHKRFFDGLRKAELPEQFHATPEGYDLTQTPQTQRGPLWVKSVARRTSAIGAQQTCPPTSTVEVCQKLK